MVKEEFVPKTGAINKKDGTQLRFVYIDPRVSENTYDFRELIKKYGASWIKSVPPKGAWGWWLDGKNDESIIRQYVQPCMQALDKVAKQNGNKGDNSIIALIDSILAQLNTTEVVDSGQGVQFDPQKLKNSLMDLKRELVSAVSSEEFKALIEPILKFKRALGHQFSWTNTMLIWIQDRQAKLVKSKGRWAKMNRVVKPDAPVIALIAPAGEKRRMSDEEKNAYIEKFIAKVGKKSYEELNPGEKERLDVIINGRTATRFELVPAFYDYRFTTQMDGKDDLVGDIDADVPWFEETDETNETILYVEAMKNVIANSGVKINYTDDLDGARGVSKSGSIEFLSSAKREWGFLNTMVHEFAHELLHQKYLKNNNPEMAKYFVGNSEGRGMVEQQAELCAWIVLKVLGKDMPTNINYVGIWGLNPDNATKVFDTVSNVSDYIYKSIIKEVENIRSSGRKIAESVSNGTTQVPSGREIAYMVGCGKVYDMAAKKEETEISQINESFFNVLNKIN